jgi:peptide/nickel transport system ATP-binding protein
MNALAPPQHAPPLHAPILEVEGLSMHFPIRKGLLRRQVGAVKAVDAVSFALREGETLGVVGESGCGKSTLTRCLLGIYTPTAGAIRYRDGDGALHDIARIPDAARKRVWKDIRLVFQDPHASLNPRMTAHDIISEALRVQGLAREAELPERIAGLMARVGLRPEYARRFPHAFSGGERQRIGIARALATDPRVVVLDEAVSALDVSVRAQTLNLLSDLRDQYGLTYLFVSHDLSVIEYICDRVVVMYAGQIVEIAPVAELFARPRHPYTEALLSALPLADPRARRRGQRIRLKGEVADPANRPPGCAFHPRCRHATDLCRTTAPPRRALGAGVEAACHHAEALALAGVTPPAAPAIPAPGPGTGESP